MIIIVCLRSSIPYDCDIIPHLPHHLLHKVSSSVASLAMNQSFLVIGFTNGAVVVIMTCKFSNFDKTTKVLDATRGELFCRLQAPDNLQGSGCRVQFGEESFLTRLFFWNCKRNDRSFPTRTVFGTTEDKNSRQGQDLHITINQ